MSRFIPGRAQRGVGGQVDALHDREVRAYFAKKDSPPLDNGCDLHDDCLSCPFEFCRYDVPIDQQALIVRAS